MVCGPENVREGCRVTVSGQKEKGKRKGGRERRRKRKKKALVAIFL